MNRLLLAMVVLGCWCLPAPAHVADESVVAEGESTTDVDELIQKLSSSSFIQRDWAARRLMQRGPDIVPELIAAIKHSDSEEVSSAAVRQLDRMAHSRDLSIAGAALQGLSSLDQLSDDLPVNVRGSISDAYQNAARHNLAQLAALGAHIEWDDAGQIDQIAVRSEQLDDHFMPLVCAFTSITRLDLRDSAITGDSLPHLASLVNLEHLNLTDTRLTGDDLRQLPALPQLRQLTLYRIPLSDEDRRWLRKHLPRCHISP